MISSSDLKKFYRKASVAVIGDVMIDRYLNGNAERISPEAPIPIVNINEIRNLAGGAANVMSNVAGLGAKVWGFGVIGNDSDGELVKRILLQKGIDSTNIVLEADRPTTLKCRVMVGHHQIVRYDMEKHDGIDKKSEEKLVDGINQIADLLDMIIISDYDKGVVTPSLIKSIVKIANHHKLRILVDPKVKNTWNYIGADYIKINLHNAERVCNMSYHSEADLKKMCQMISKSLRCNNIIVTMGKDGLSFFSEGGLVHIPSIAKDVYDVTGAGDVMTAILGIALSNGYDIKTACYLGTIAAAIKVSKIGTYSLTREEFMEAVNSYHKAELL